MNKFNVAKNSIITFFKLLTNKKLSFKDGIKELKRKTISSELNNCFNDYFSKNNKAKNYVNIHMNKLDKQNKTEELQEIKVTNKQNSKDISKIINKLFTYYDSEYMKQLYIANSLKKLIYAHNYFNVKINNTINLCKKYNIDDSRFVELLDKINNCVKLNESKFLEKKVINSKQEIYNSSKSYQLNVNECEWFKLYNNDENKYRKELKNITMSVIEDIYKAKTCKQLSKDYNSFVKNYTKNIVRLLNRIANDTSITTDKYYLTMDIINVMTNIDKLYLNKTEALNNSKECWNSLAI